MNLFEANFIFKMLENQTKEIKNIWCRLEHEQKFFFLNERGQWKNVKEKEKNKRVQKNSFFNNSAKNLTKFKFITCKL